MLQNSNKALEQKNKELQQRLEESEAKMRELTEKAHQAEREKEQIQIDSQSKIEILQYKLLNKFDSTSSQDDQTAFKELLSLCRSDLGEILQRLKNQTKSDEETLRKELLEANKK